MRVTRYGVRVAGCLLRVGRYEVRVLSFAGLGGLLKIMLPLVLLLIKSDPAFSPNKLTQKADLKE